MSHESSGPSHHPFRMALCVVCMAAVSAVWAFVLLGFSVAALLFNPAATVPYAVRIASPGSRVAVEQFEVVSMWPLAVEVQRMQVHGQDGAELFAVERATIMTDPKAGWEDGLWIRDMELHGPRITIYHKAGEQQPGEGAAAVWDPESLRGLFFYKEVHCTEGSFILQTANRTVEAQDLAFSLVPAGDAGGADPTLRSANLNGMVRISEAGRVLARAQLQGQGEVRADRFSMDMQLTDGGVDMDEAAGELTAQAGFVLTPDSLDVDRLELDFTPTDDFRQQTGLEGRFRLALDGRLLLGESRYELTNVEAELPDVFSLHGNATGDFEGMPSTATFTLQAPALDRVLEQARRRVAALENVQGRGGPIRATVQVDRERVGIDLHAENATVALGDGDLDMTAQTLDCNGTTPRNAEFEALAGGDFSSWKTLGLSGTVAAVVDASGGGWAVQNAEFETEVDGTASALSATNATLRLPADSLSRSGEDVRVGAVVASADASWTDEALEVHRLDIQADGVGVIHGQGAWSPGPDGQTIAALSGQGLHLGGLSTLVDSVADTSLAAWSPSGVLDLDFEVDQTDQALAYDVQTAGSAMAFSSPDGEYLAEKISWSLDASGTMDDATSFRATASIGAGQFLLGRFFLDAGANPVRVDGSGRLAGDALRGVDADVTIGGVGNVAYSGSVNLAAGPAYDGNLVLTSDTLSALYGKGVVEPFSSDLPVLSDYSVDGSMKFDVAVQGSGSDVQAAGMLTLTGASFESAATGMQAQNVSIELPIAYGREPLSGKTHGFVRVGSVQSPLGELDNLSLTLGYEGGALGVAESMTLPVLGGELRVSDIAVRNPYSPDFEVTCQAVLNGARLDELDVGGMTIQGDIEGNLGKLRLTRKRLEIPGALGGTFFGGSLAIHNMGVAQPLTKGRQILATIGMENVHLAPLSQATGIGKITGRLNVVVEDMAVVYGQPAAFILTAKSQDVDGVEQSISLKAVNSITVLGTGSSIGDAGVGVFGSFFKEFSYGEIGVQLSLRNDVFKVRGLIEEDGVEYLIKKPPLFGINVINRTPGKRVSFSDMLERLSRITAEGSGPKTETEFGAGGSGETQGE